MIAYSLVAKHFFAFKSKYSPTFGKIFRKTEKIKIAFVQQRNFVSRATDFRSACSQTGDQKLESV